MKRKVLLVGWDAADWKVIAPLVDSGRMPNVARLVESGTMGNLATLSPILSPMLWTSIATGKRPCKHGIHGFSEPDPQSGGVRPITNLSRTTKAVWNILNQEGKTSLVVGWWPSSPAEPIRGAMVSNHFQQAVAEPGKPWPMRPGTVHPPELAEELAKLRLHPYEIEGDVLRNFVPRAPEIDQHKDQRLLTVAKIFAECSGIHAAAVHLMRTMADWDFAAVYFDAIDHFGHAFMRYHPPRLDWVSVEDFDTYKGVVEGGYIYHDMMLGGLLNVAGPDATVILISDHGFHPDHLRPRNLPNEPAGPAAEHRQFGIFVAAGPGIKRDELVFGASVLDVAPTILSLFGLPVGRDMDGRVLTTLWDKPAEVEFIDSWDARPGEDGRHPTDARIDPADAREAIRQLVDLGYIDEPDADVDKAVDETVRELRYNLARACVDGGRTAEAREIFADLWERWPEESRFGVHLLQSRIDDGEVLEARETMTLLRERKAAAAKKAAAEIETSMQKIRADTAKHAVTDGKTDIAIDWEKVGNNEKQKLRRLRARAATNVRAFAYLEGSLLHLEGRHAEAMAALRQALEAQTASLPGLYLKMGQVAVAMRDWSAAEEAYRHAADLDPLNTPAHLGLARVALHREDWETAAGEAAIAAGQQYHLAPAHYFSGLALWRLGRPDEALAWLERAVAINPVYPAAHRTLAAFHRRERADWLAHVRHRRLARDARQRIAKHRVMGFPQDRHPMEVRAAFGAEDPEHSAQTDAAGPAPVLPPREDTIIVVTGLPRTGTSMAMQMLEAGGIPVLADDQRPPDDSNPRGYLELEAARRLANDASWLPGARGRAVKIIAQLLPSLTREQRYRIVMMHRPLREVVASQKKMLARLGKPGAAITDDALRQTFHRQVAQVRTLLMHLRKQGILDVLDLKYADVIRDPRAAAAQMADFLGQPFDKVSAAAAVTKELRHETGQD